MNFDRAKEIYDLIVEYMKKKSTDSLMILIDFSQGGITRVRKLDKFKDL